MRKLRSQSLFFFFVSFLFLFVVHAAHIEFSGNVNGNQQVPPVTTNGEGSAKCDYDTSSQKLDCEVAFDFLQSGITMAHIHGPAFEGENADVLFTFDVDEGDTQGDFKAEFRLTNELERHLRMGMFYVNIHTEDSANGEIRGQLLTTERHFKAELSGDQQVPPVNTDADGFAKFKVDYESNAVEYEIEHSVRQPTAIHFHGPAQEGQTADLLVELLDSGRDISGSVVLTPEQLGYFRSGLMYINVHSEQHTDGEIRGQIVIDDDGGSGGSSWWITGLVLVGILLLVLIIAVAGMLLYKKKGEQIRKYFSVEANREAVRDSFSSDLGNVSSEPLLSSNSSI